MWEPAGGANSCDSASCVFRAPASGLTLSCGACALVCSVSLLPAAGHFAVAMTLCPHNAKHGRKAVNPPLSVGQVINQKYNNIQVEQISFPQDFFWGEKEITGREMKVVEANEQHE